MTPPRITIHEKGIIYQLYCFQNEKFYYGSTGGTIRQRKSKHIRDRNSKQCQKRPITKWINDIGKENVLIKEIKSFDNITRGDLQKEEEELICKSRQDGNCLNCVKAYRTEEEKDDYEKKWYIDNKEKRIQWLIDNKEKLKEDSKVYYENNKNEISRKKKEYYEKHKEEFKEYYQEHKEELSNKRKEKEIDKVKRQLLTEEEKKERRKIKNYNYNINHKKKKKKRKKEAYQKLLKHNI